MKNIDKSINESFYKLIKKNKLSVETNQTIKYYWDWQNASPSFTNSFKWAKMTLLCSELISGDKSKALPGALAMEIYALSADILDDIQDNDNHIAPWSGKPLEQSLTIGICLLFLSYKALNAIEIKAYKKIFNLFNKTGAKASDGQHIEFLYDNKENITFYQYMDIVKKKSGSLTKCAFEVGAILGGASTKVINLIGQLGGYIGILSQIRNDLRDFLNIELKSDFKKRKKTLPYIYLKNYISETNAQKLDNLYKLVNENIENIGNKEKEELYRITFKEGTIHYCLVIQEIIRKKALDTINQIPIIERKKGKLIKLVNEISALEEL